MAREIGGGGAYGDGGAAAMARASWQLHCPSSLTGGLSASLQTPLGTCSLRLVGHDGQAKMDIRLPLDA